MKKIETARQFDKDLKAIGLMLELIDVLTLLSMTYLYLKNTMTTHLKAISKYTVNAT